MPVPESNARSKAIAKPLPLSGVPPNCLQQRVEAAFADPPPNVPARAVFKRLREHHARQVKTARSGKT